MVRMCLSDRRTGGSAREVPVLMYHSIASGTPRTFRRFAVDPDEFATQMTDLGGAGYCPVTVAELAASRTSGRPLPRHPVVITFDDVYADFYSAALPVPREHNFSATLYAPTGYVGATSRSNGSRVRSAVSGEGFRYACVVGNLMAPPDDDIFTSPRPTVKAGIGVADRARLLTSRPAAGRRRAAAMQRAASLAVRRWTPVMGDPREGWPPT